MKKWLLSKGIDIYSTYNEGKSVIAERFIKTLKTKLYKHMTAISSDVYYDVLDDIVDEYNNTAEVKNSDYEGYVYEFDEKKPLFNIGDKVRISKFLQKGTLPIGQKKHLLCVV